MMGWYGFFADYFQASLLLHRKTYNVVSADPRFYFAFIPVSVPAGVLYHTSV